VTNPLALLTVQRLEASGSLESAFRGFLDLGRKGDAARVALRLQRLEEAARLYTEAGMPFEAAGAWYQAGNFAASLDQLGFVPHDHPQYRQACVHAIHLANRLNQLDFGVENLVGDFAATLPADPQELEAFLLLAGLYEREGFAENALGVVTRALVRAPNNTNAISARSRIEKAVAAAKVASGSVLTTDAAFFGRSDQERPVTLPPDALGPIALPPRETLFEVTASAPRTPASALAPAKPSAAPPFAGRFRLEARIGVGGMAEVWRATDLDVGEEIALKIFQPLADPAAEERIKAELKLTRRLAHPNVVRIYDIGVHENRRYISMELLQGRDLQQVPKPATPANAVDWLVQACDGLQIAHDQGVIHRDVKPENLFLTNAGKLKVMDFGIAKDTEVRRTRAGMIAGTPEFMSPEQINDMSQVTPATDLYSLGVVAYELLTGTLPFTHKELMPLLMMHTKDLPPRPRTRRPDLSEALEGVILQALEKDPTKRFASAQAMAAALRAALA